MVCSGHSIMKVHTVDTDVIVTGLAMFQIKTGLQELWIEFAIGNTKESYPIHEPHAKLGADKAKAMIFFHPLTGCNKVHFSVLVKKLKHLGQCSWSDRNF